MAQPRSELEGVVVLTEQILGTAASKWFIPNFHSLLFIHPSSGISRPWCRFFSFSQSPKPSLLLWWTSAVGRFNVVGLSRVWLFSYFPSVTSSKGFQHVPSHFLSSFSQAIFLRIDRFLRPNWRKIAMYRSRRMLRVAWDGHSGSLFHRFRQFRAVHFSLLESSTAWKDANLHCFWKASSNRVCRSCSVPIAALRFAYQARLCRPAYRTRNAVAIDPRS